MASRKFLIGGGTALAALFARLRRGAQTQPPPPPDPVLEDEPGDEIEEHEVDELREDLRRELARLADGDIKASRTRRESTSPPG
jgi:hypothetical protein